MKVKPDEKTGRRGADLLREAGHDVSTVVEQNLSGTPDIEVIERRRSEHRCLVTLDVDFANPFLFHPPDYAGIAVSRLTSRITRAGLHSAIRSLTKRLTQDTIDGKRWIVQPGRIREYQSEDARE